MSIIAQKEKSEILDFQYIDIPLLKRYNSKKVFQIMINNTNLPLVASVRSRFGLNQTKKISFNGIPFSLPDLPMDDAKDAILIFDYLKLGNYLD